MKTKKIEKLLSIMMLFSLLVAVSPVFAVDGPPAGFEGMTAAPSQEQINQLMQQGQNAAKVQQEAPNQAAPIQPPAPDGASAVPPSAPNIPIP